MDGKLYTVRSIYSGGAIGCMQKALSRSTPARRNPINLRNTTFCENGKTCSVRNRTRPSIPRLDLSLAFYKHFGMRGREVNTDDPVYTSYLKDLSFVSDIPRSPAILVQTVPCFH